jgi:hypothetical protein
MTDEELAALEAEKAAVEKAEQEEARKAKEAEEAEKLKSPDKDKKPSMTDAEAKALKELMQWKAKAREAEKQAKELSEKYGDIDLDKVRETLKAAEEAENRELEKKGEYDRLLAKQREAADAKIEAEKKRADELAAKITEMAATVDKLALGNSFANSAFIKENLALTANKTQALYATHFEIEDGKVVAYDAPKGSANRTPIVDARGEAKPFDEALADIINADPDKDYLLKSGTKPGAGSKPAADGTKETGKQFSSSLEKLAHGLKDPKNFGYTGKK